MGSSANIGINVADAFDWDDVEHEYGHWVEGYYDFANVDAGLQHSFGQHNPGGVTEAFCEGWADSFPVAAEQYEKRQPYAANVPHQGSNGSYLTAILNETGVGEDDELSVAGVLYHLNAGDEGFTISDKIMFKDFKSDDITTIGGAWGVFASDLNAEERATLGYTFGKENIAPVEGAATMNGNVPTFTFTRNGAPGNYQLNKFVIQIYSSDFKTLLGTLTVPALGAGNTDATVSFTPTAQQWAGIVKNNSAVQWIVEGENTLHQPSTPGGKVARYWSAAQLLTI